MKYDKMAVVRLTFILLLQCIFLINIQCDNDFHESSDELFRPQIWCFVNYLNANPDRLYNYNYGTLINAQNKDLDNTDLTIDVEVECRNRNNGCDVNLMECIGTVKYNTDTANYEVLPGATCSQKTQIDTTSYYEQDYSSTDAPQEEIVTRSEYYSNAEPVQEEQFVKKTVPLLGGPMDLNLNIEGLDLLTTTALKHIESERNYKLGLVRVVRVQRQIVSGVKYILTLEIAPTNCPKNLEPTTTYTCSIVTSAEPEICEITYYQQPWISHKKNIISNNCTETQEFTEDGINSAANDQDNEIDTNYNPKKLYGYRDQPEQADHYPNYDVIADTGNADDILKMSGGVRIDAARLRDIESQIIGMIDTPKIATTTDSRDEEIVNNEQYISKVNAEISETTEESINDATTEEITTENPMLTDAQKAAFDDFMDMMGNQQRVKRGAKNDDDSSSSSSSSSEEDDNDNNNNGNDKEYEKTKRKYKKYTKKNKHDNDNNDDDDDDDDNNNNDNEKNKKNDDSSSSSSSSSSEEDDNGKNQKNKKSKRSADDSSSSSEENNAKVQHHASSSNSEEGGNDEDNRTKRETKPNSSESNETSEEKHASSTVPSVAQNLIAQKQDTSEEESSEEHRGGVRRKRNVPNDFIKVTPDERNFVHNLAEFSVRTLDDIDADNHKRVILQVLGAKKNAEGNLYHLTVRVGVSKCPEDDDPIIDLNKELRKDKCRNKLFENLTKICKVQINVDDKINPKVEKSQCQNMKKEQDDADVNRTNRGMFRSKRGSERLAGGINKVDPESSEIQQYVRNVLTELNAKDGLTAPAAREYIKVHEASKQVVSGMLYRFKVEIKEGGIKKMCSIHVWDQAWLNPPKEVKITCDDGVEEKKYRFKRAHNFGLFGKDDHDVHIGLFKDFMNKHNKQYSSKTEFKNRFRVFKQNMKTIKLLNDNEQGTAKYGPTMFADLTNDEYKQYLGLKPEMRNINNIPMPHAKIPDVEIPVEYDWRKKGVISEVKNQGGCGSCWAFSVTGNIEGLNAIKTGNLIELSEQELVDCDTLDSGCNGGLPDNAYRAIEQLGGLETETDYPYEAENEKCVFNKTLSKVQISGAVNISTNETDMAKWLIKNGPISIGINANAMQFYMGGVSHPWKFLCNPTSLDHGVLIVGYGTHKYPLFNKIYPYWIIKNSWGPTWGEQGYYRVYRGDGTCGVNMMASSAVL